MSFLRQAGNEKRDEVMLKYNLRLKRQAQALRNNMTEAEQKLWWHLRRKQIQGVQFYRQKCLGQYIVDFYASRVKLVIEIDGSQHFEQSHVVKDRIRDTFLATLGLTVLRFHNGQIFEEIDSVLEAIFRHVTSQVSSAFRELI